MAVVEGTQEAGAQFLSPWSSKKEYTTTTGQAHAYNNIYYIYAYKYTVAQYHQARVGRY